MRRERRGKVETKGMNKNLLYIGGSLLGIGIISFAITFVLYGNKMKEQTSIGEEKIARLVQEAADSTKSISTQMGKTVEESKNEISNNANTVTNKTTTNTITKNTTTKNVTSNTTNTVNTNKKEETNKTQVITFVKPVDGEITKEFAKEKLVYSNTLEEWATHLGIDIKADKTTVVKASEAGTIKSIKNDPRYGLSVIVEHQDGYETLYANLLTAEFVKVGEQVKQGQSIGTVGDTATFEIADEAHLHFEITKNGEQIDPTTLIK
ncbi:MAG: M23 family metallopeptidase [Clostridia bacterium]|nr:M23 family metallopeptidase [Clostridia bacterium]